MSYPHARRPLDVKQPLYAVRSFMWDGRGFEVGDPFPVDKAEAHRVRQLWEQRFIDHARLVAPESSMPVASAPRQTHQPDGHRQARHARRN